MIRSMTLAAIAALIPQIAFAAGSMSELEQEALLSGRSEMLLTDTATAPIKIKAARGNFIAQTGCAFVSVAYIFATPTVTEPKKVGVFETTSPVCPAGDENKAIELGAHKG